MSRRLGLVIGNSAYRDSTLARLATPDVDVGDFADVLLDPEVGGFDDVKVLVNSSSSTIRRTISEFFSGKEREDLLLLYFSGHGVLDDQGRLFLAVKDTEHNLLRATAIPAYFITDEMNNSRSQRQVLILDCCHSGAFARGTKGVPGATVGTATAFEGNGYGRVVLTASDATQYAWEGDRVLGTAENSVFTKHLVNGLRSGEADLDHDGQISIDELFDYTEEHVHISTSKQTPGKWSYKQQGDIVLARNPFHTQETVGVFPAPEIGARRAVKKETKRRAPPPVEEKPAPRKLPVWAWIVIGVLVIGIFGLLFSNVISPYIPSPHITTQAPGTGEKAFDLNSAILTLTAQAEQSPPPTRTIAVIEATPQPQSAQASAVLATQTQSVISLPTLPPTPPSPVFTALITVQAANLRSGPGVVYPVITFLQQGTELKIIGKNSGENWLTVELDNGRQAWINVGVVEMLFDLTDLPVINAPPTPTSPPRIPTKTPKPSRYGAAIYVPPALDGENPVAPVDQRRKLYSLLLTILFLFFCLVIEDRKIRQQHQILIKTRKVEGIDVS